MDRIDFNVDVECGKRTILYVQTFDRRFRTPEGLAIGDRIGQVLRAGGRVTDDGTLLLPSGWAASMTEGTIGPEGSARIYFFASP